MENLCITDYVKNIPPSIENFRVADIIYKNNNSWNLTLIEYIYPSFSILEKIHDWEYAKHGKFCLNWQTHNGIPNSEFLYKRKIIDSNVCPLCRSTFENNKHLFFFFFQLLVLLDINYQLLLLILMPIFTISSSHNLLLFLYFGYSGKLRISISFPIKKTNLNTISVQKDMY